MLSKKMARPQLIGLMALALAIVAAAALRLSYGVDFTDEAFYATLPYRFVLGDTPYVSDLGVAQNGGLIVTPLVWLWVTIVGDNDGLILFLRFVYLGMRVSLAALAVLALWNRTSRGLAIVAPLIICSFVLYSIPAPSYNTLSGSAISAALLSFLLWTENRNTRWAVAAFLCCTVAAFVHPGLSLASVAIVAAVIARAENVSARQTLFRALGVVAGIGVVLSIVAVIALGLSNVARLVSEVGAFAGPSRISAHLASAPAQLLSLWTGRALVLIWAAFWFAHRLPLVITAVLAAAYLVLGLSLNSQAGMILLGVAAIPLAWRTWRAGGEIDLLIAAALSVFTGLSVAQFSTNGAPNAAVGAEVAVIAFFVAGRKFLDTRPGVRRWEASLLHAPLMLALWTVFRFSVAQWTYVYADDPVSRLSAVVADGPYRGLRTTPEKNVYLEAVQRVLSTHGAGKKSLLVFNRFPGAYLMLPVPPATPVTWVADGDDAYVVSRRAGIARFLGTAGRPMLVLQVFRLPLSTASQDRWEYGADDPLFLAVQAERPVLLAANADFALYEIPARAVR